MATKKTAPKNEPTADTSSHTSSNSSNSSIPGMNDLLSLLGGASPVMAIGRMVETVMHVTGDIVQSIGTFNDTMTELNKVARRVNALLDEIEGPVAEIIPLVQASAKQAKSTLKKVDGVIDQIGTLPADVTKAVSTLGDLAGRLGPLAQFAEVAGGMFGMKPTAN
jgi:ABC-type transporter Mla subunit MlaD